MKSTRDELSTNDEQKAAEIADFLNNSQSGSNPVDEAAIEEGLNVLEDFTKIEADPDLEVPDSDFWNSGDEEESLEVTPSEVVPHEVEEEATVSATPHREIYEFKANGKTIRKELTHEELLKELSLNEGSRQAFSDKAKLKKELDKIKKERDDLQGSWDSLEKVKHDKEQLFKLITGEDYEDFIQDEIARRNIMEHGTDTEKRMLEQDLRLQEMNRKLAAAEESNKRTAHEVETKRMSAERAKLESAIDTELSKYELPTTEDPVVTNKLNTILKDSIARDVRRYYQEYGQITKKMVAKAVSDNTKALTGGYKYKAEEELKKVTRAKRADAKSQAQIAANRPVSRDIAQETAGMSANEIFKFLKRNS
jgi:hypothetical protein